MKAALKFTTAIALMLVVATGMAREPKVSIITKEDKKTLVFEWETQKEDTHIQIVDTNGNIIYTENVSDTEIYAKKFDLNNLEEGEYLLEAENKLKKVTFNIAIDENVKVTYKKESTKPFFRTETDKVHLNLLNLSKDKVDVKVLDSDNRVVFKEAYKDKMLIGKTFNFQKAYDNRYTIIVKMNGETYYEEIVVN